MLLAPVSFLPGSECLQAKLQFRKHDTTPGSRSSKPIQLFDAKDKLLVVRACRRWGLVATPASHSWLMVVVSLLHNPVFAVDVASAINCIRDILRFLRVNTLTVLELAVSLNRI